MKMKQKYVVDGREMFPDKRSIEIKMLFKLNGTNLNFERARTSKFDSS